MFLKCCKSQRGLTSCRLNSIWTSMFFSKIEILSFLAFHRSSFAGTRRAGPARAQPARAGPSHAKSDRKLDTRSDTPLEEHHVDDERFFLACKGQYFFLFLMREVVLLCSQFFRLLQSIASLKAPLARRPGQRWDYNYSYSHRAPQ